MGCLERWKDPFGLQLSGYRIQRIHSTVIEQTRVRDERSTGSSEGRGVHVKLWRLVLVNAGDDVGLLDRNDPLYGRDDISGRFSRRVIPGTVQEFDAAGEGRAKLSGHAQRPENGVGVRVVHCVPGDGFVRRLGRVLEREGAVDIVLDHRQPQVVDFQRRGGTFGLEHDRFEGIKRVAGHFCAYTALTEAFPDTSCNYSH